MRAISLGLALACFISSPGWAAGKAKHIVVVVWDGMRPDFVTEQHTPTLHRFVQDGVFFRNHHPVYPSSTEVNGAALATGAYPRRSGVIANKEYRPEIDPHKPIGTESLDAMRQGDKLSNGNYLNLPTVAEIIRRNGHRTAIAGTKPVVLLQDRAERPNDAANIVLYEGRTLPATALGSITNALGPFPEAGTTKTNRDLWTTRALIGPMWEPVVPTFSLLWLAEPDFSQHNTSPGSDRSLTAIRSSDHQLSLILGALKQKGVYEQTDIFVVSDHAFSTIARGVDLAARLQTNSFNASREFKTPPTRGDVLVAGNAGSVLLYVCGHDEGTVQRLIDFLQREDYVGVIFTRRPAEGTFALNEARIDSPNGPDIAFSMRWNDGKNPSGVAGHVMVDGEKEDVAAIQATLKGDGRKGSHVTLSPFDMHNTLVAAGPDFRPGFVDQLPSGNIDVAPTILHILSIKPPKRLDGRVLTEALTIDGPKVGRPKATRIEATHGQQKFVWRQYLKRTELNGVVYLDEGNGVATPN